MATQVSFRSSVHEYIEKWATSASTLIGAVTDLSPSQNAVISYGFMRRIRVRLRNITGGTGGNFNLDYPAGLLNTLLVSDPNGAEVYGGSTWNGYLAYLAEKYGSYKAVNDPTLATIYDPSVTAPQFLWTVPFELAEASGLGALPNFDAQSPYQIKAILDSSANAYQTAPTTAPTVMPSTTATPAVPPPTTREPLPQAMSESSRTNSDRYCRNAMGTEAAARTKKTSMWPRRASGRPARWPALASGSSSRGR